MKNKGLLILTSSFCLVLVLTLLMFLPACTSGPTADKPITLRYTSGSSLKDPKVIIVDGYFKPEIEKRTGGKVIIEFHPGAELYKHSEAPDGVISNAVQIGYTSLAERWSDFNPVLEYGQTYFLLQSADTFLRDMQPWRDLLYPIYEEQGVKVLHFLSNGMGGIISRKPINGPDDLQGLIIRGPTASDFLALEALGATPTRVATAEMFDALSKGSIDGIRTSVTAMAANKLHEAGAGYLLFPVDLSIWVVFMNLDEWNSLPKDLQDTIMEVAQDTENKSFSEIGQAQAEAMELLNAVTQVYTPSPADVVEFQKRLQPVIDATLAKSIEKGYGEEAQRFLDLARKG
ncbi:TRAP transporter substrate-binding protein [Chloroflexota bacterium]